MFEIDSSGLESAAERFDEVSDGLDDAARRSGRDGRTVHNAVEEGTSSTLEDRIVQVAQAQAAEHVGDHADNIRTTSGEWHGKRYSDGLVADDEVVLAHEFGTGIHGDGSRYRIPGRLGDGPLVLNVGGEPHVVEYVMHPGVDEEGFIRESLQDGANDVFETVQDEVMDRLREAFR